MQQGRAPWAPAQGRRSEEGEVSQLSGAAGGGARCPMTVTVTTDDQDSFLLLRLRHEQLCLPSPGLLWPQTQKR